MQRSLFIWTFEKAFDNLWLESCIVDMYKRWVKENLRTNFHELNNEGYIQIYIPGDPKKLHELDHS